MVIFIRFIGRVHRCPFVIFLYFFHRSCRKCDIYGVYKFQLFILLKVVRPMDSFAHFLHYSFHYYYDLWNVALRSQTGKLKILARTSVHQINLADNQYLFDVKTFLFQVYFKQKEMILEQNTWEMDKTMLQSVGSLHAHNP